jgi:hypothetical protein
MAVILIKSICFVFERFVKLIKRMSFSLLKYCQDTHSEFQALVSQKKHFEIAISKKQVNQVEKEYKKLDKVVQEMRLKLKLFFIDLKAKLFQELAFEKRDFEKLAEEWEEKLKFLIKGVEKFIEKDEIDKTYLTYQLRNLVGEVYIMNKFTNSEIGKYFKSKIPWEKLKKEIAEMIQSLTDEEKSKRKTRAEYDEQISNLIDSLFFYKSVYPPLEGLEKELNDLSKLEIFRSIIKDKTIDDILAEVYYVLSIFPQKKAQCKRNIENVRNRVIDQIEEYQQKREGENNESIMEELVFYYFLKKIDYTEDRIVKEGCSNIKKLKRKIIQKYKNRKPDADSLAVLWFIDEAIKEEVI